MTTKTALPYKQTFLPEKVDDFELSPAIVYVWLTPDEQKEFDAMPMDEWLWVTKKGEPWRLKNMARTHIQNCLNWCIKKPSSHRKDGRLYQDWITALTVKLFDPSVE
jgi:hypothetical protein